MNKSALRNFAVWARRDLIKRISDRANLLGVYEDKPAKPIQVSTENSFMVNGITFDYKESVRNAFIEKVKELGYKDAIEEIAYTWFNRIVALRFMEINGYLTNGKNGERIYIIGSTSTGKTEPDAITYADKLSFVDKFKVYDFQDTNNTNGLYRYILTKQCNELNKVMPQMFVEIDDYVELLLPDHLLDKGAIIDRLISDINEKDFNITIKDEDGENASQVEIIGWLYQFYISEKKDEVFANKDQITKGTLPAVTQLFTPDWIVKYMVENSLGKMWIDGHKNSLLLKDLKYFIADAEQTEDVKIKIEQINKEYATKNIKDITFIDPCCGSGHILVYAFDLFYKMYLENGYFAGDIPALILQNNLVGIDIDKRAAQLTSFALTMKALSYDKTFLSKGIYPTVIDVKESNSLNLNEVKEFIKLAKLNNQDEEIIFNTIEKFNDAELYGSLIKNFNYSPEQYDGLYQQINNNIHADEHFNLIDRFCVLNVKPILCSLLKQAYILSSKYDIMVTNPPYLAPSTNEKLKQFAATYYPDSKTDMFAMFMEVPLVKTNGFLAMINMQSWLFLGSYEKLRLKLLHTKDIVSLLHLGARAFEEISGEVVQTVSFVLRNQVDMLGKYYKLTDGKSQYEKENDFLNYNIDDIYTSKIKSFNQIPGISIAYWISEKCLNLFGNEKKMKDFAAPKQGLATTDNNKFIRFWQEVDISNIGFNLAKEAAITSQFKWFPINKGGEFKKWYGNNDCIVNYKNDGQEIKESVLSKYPYLKTPDFVVKNAEYYFKENGTWSAITSNDISVRYSNQGFLISNAGMAIYNNLGQLKYIIGFMNSKVANYLIKVVNQTLNFNAGDIEKIPLIFDKVEELTQLANENINTSKIDYDQYETSWNFKQHPLMPAVMCDYSLAKQFNDYKNVVNVRFDALKYYEEKLNKLFIEIYGLQDELTPNVLEKDITITKIYETKEDISEEMKNNNYIKTKQDVVKDFISYIVGCAFGRYSPYNEGLQFAGGEFDWFNYIVNEEERKNVLVQNVKGTVSSFMPTYDHCLVNTNNDYIENDLTSYVVEFIEKVYGATKLNENLKFIANALDENSTDTPKNVIRKYLSNEFFKDHCKKYQNRPIYWQLDSGKNGGFRALIYLHRYDENTLPTARFNYLHDLQWKYEQEKDRLEKVIENSSITSEKAKAKKELDLINKQIVECQAYDEILNHATNMKINLDLDDGVKVNYQKLQKLDGDKDKNILSTYLKF